MQTLLVISLTLFAFVVGGEIRDGRWGHGAVGIVAFGLGVWVLVRRSDVG